MTHYEEAAEIAPEKFRPQCYIIYISADIKRQQLKM